MAGGEGARLRPLTINRPKPMVPVVNRVCLEHVLHLLREHGFTDVIITVHYLASHIFDYFGDGRAFGLRINYSLEPTPLGTAGSVKLAERDLDGTFLVISGDALTDVNLTEIIEAHRARQALVTIALYRVPNPLEYGVVVTDPDGRIRQFQEKPDWGQVISDTVNTGIYVLEPEVLKEVPTDRPYDFSADLFPKLLQRGERLFGHVVRGYWTDIGSIQEYVRASFDLLNGQVNLGPLGLDLGNGVWVEAEDVDISPGAAIIGPVYIGSGCRIQRGASVVGPAVIRRNTIIDEGAEVHQSIIWRDCYVAPHAQVRGAVLLSQVNVRKRARVMEGAVIGDETVIGEDAVIQPDVKIWPKKEVESGAIVSESIIWAPRVRRVLFGRFGVSGLANMELTPEFAAKLGAAYGTTLPKGAKVIINRDPHRIPRMIKRGFIAGLPSAGINVLDIKSAPTPVARFLTAVTDAAGGVHVRLSPFDPRVVDIKFFDSRGLDIDQVTERKIENAFFRGDVRRVFFDEIGSIVDAPHLVSQYEEAFIRAFDGRLADGTRPPVVVDYAHGSSVLVLPQLLDRLGLNVISLNAALDEARLAQPPDVVEQAIQRLAAIVRAVGGALGVYLEPGGERLRVVDDLGLPLDGMKLLTALVALVLRENPAGVVAVPVTATRAVDQVAAEFGVRVQRTRANHQALMAAATHSHVVFAGDGEGCFIFPRFQPTVDGLFAIARIADLLGRHGVTLSELVRQLPALHMVRRRVPCPWEKKGRVMRRFHERFPEHSARQIDGFQLDVPGGWVLILPDADRPIVHIIAESEDPDRALELAESYSQLVADFQA